MKLYRNIGYKNALNITMVNKTHLHASNISSINFVIKGDIVRTKSIEYKLLNVSNVE